VHVTCYITINIRGKGNQLSEGLRTKDLGLGFRVATLIHPKLSVVSAL